MASVREEREESPSPSEKSLKKNKKRKKPISSGSSESSGESDSSVDVQLKKKKKSKRQSKKAKNKKTEKTTRPKWTNEEIFKLIDLVEARTCLWDVFSESYHDRTVVERARRELEEALERDWINEISPQIVSLRATLGQNLKKQRTTKSGQAVDDVFEPSWIFFKALQFMVPAMEARTSRDTLKVHVIADEEDNDVLQLDDKESSCSSAGSSAKKPKKSVRAGTKEQAVNVKADLMKECIKLMQAPPTPVSTTEEQLFSSFVAQKLKSFDAYTKMVAEKKIMDLLYDLQYTASAGPSQSFQMPLSQQPTAFGLQGHLQSLYSDPI